MNVQPALCKGYFDFYVHTPNETIHVKTLDFYTYLCSKCDVVDQCPHTIAVRSFVWSETLKEMDTKKNQQ